MVNEKNKKPIVLVIAGHDPSGGAGIQADIESIANAGCHATTVITSLTAQNTNTITNITPQDSIKWYYLELSMIIRRLMLPFQGSCYRLESNMAYQKHHVLAT